MSRRNKKRKTEEEEQKINDGEQDNFCSDEMKEEMKIMWEVTKITYKFIIQNILIKYTNLVGPYEMSHLLRYSFRYHKFSTFFI